MIEAHDADACCVLQARVSAGTNPELVVLMDIIVVEAHRACLLLVTASQKPVQSQ